MKHRIRIFLVVFGVVGLLALSGCLSPVSDEQLAENATYDWETNATATYQLYSDEYTAIIDIEERSSIELYKQDALGTKQALPISSLQFRYPNGTVRNKSAFDISMSQSKIELEPPAPNGTVALTAQRMGPDFTTRTLVDGSHEVYLPPGQKVDLPIVSKVIPGDYDTRSEDGRTVVRFESVETDTIIVKSYLRRDLFIFGGIAAIALLVGMGGLAYFRREVSKLESRRKEMGLDVESENDEFDKRDPPPGMG